MKRTQIEMNGDGEVCMKSYQNIFIFVLMYTHNVINNNAEKRHRKTRFYSTFVIVYSNLATIFASIGWFMGSLSYKTHYVRSESKL